MIDRLPALISEWKLDLVVVNGENAAGGFGITEVIYNELVDAGADVRGRRIDEGDGLAIQFVVRVVRAVFRHGFRPTGVRLLRSA